MGWTISHADNHGGVMRPSYTSISELGPHLAHVLSSRDWRTIAWLFDRRTEAWITIGHRDAGRMAKVLKTAASHRLMPPGWAAIAAKLAAAAGRAAATRQSWEWR
ncbi:hypothetical protein [Streptomyces sp. 5-6(2022)]|uniref:DUF7739 domain-containing protein n=1 Tax=Streptomyces sp. 5-6(2022) TaxID=2936510 RepID=UPI0023B9BFBA|nr:hypothetical protein [Streptomyces sp. 5-6(2022)]